MSQCKLTLEDTGYCVHPEHVVLRNGRLKTMRFPALFGLIEHPERGPILFDTGYGQPFLDAVQETWSGRIYGRVTPVTTSEPEFAAARCRAHGVDPVSVSLVIISHFHGDHIAGLMDFPNAQILCLRSAWESVKGLGPLRGLTKGFLPSLIPADFAERARFVEEADWSLLPPEFAPFHRGVDLLGDGSLTAVALPGHAAGQLGLFVRRAGEPDAFLVADACWTSRSFREEIMPSSVTRLLFDSTAEYRRTLGLVAEFHRRRPEVPVLPSHCEEVQRAWTGGESGP